MKKRFLQTLIPVATLFGVLLFGPLAYASGEIDIKIPQAVHDSVYLKIGLGICALGLLFGLVSYAALRRLPVHRSMKEVSDLIYETCKTYLFTQGKFILILWILIIAVLVAYFGNIQSENANVSSGMRVLLVVVFSLIGMAGSYGVAFFGIRVNTFANSRTAFASLKGKPYPTYAIPLQAGMSIGMLLISVELILMLGILLFVPLHYAGPCFMGFAIGESLGASVLRIAGGIFTKIADIGSDLMKIVFNIKEDDARNPGVIADCVGDNAGDSVGPSADGFETYGVTGVALITFLLLAIPGHYEALQAQLLIWLFVMRIAMIIVSAFSYFLNQLIAKARYSKAEQMNFEAPLTSLVWITSLVSVATTFGISYVLLKDQITDLWWQLSIIISCGTLAGAIIPEMIKVFTSTKSAHVKEVVTASREGGASLNVLAGLIAGNFSAYWMGMVLAGLMGVAYFVSQRSLSLMISDGGIWQYAYPVFAFGLVAFGFLGMGPVTIAVDSYGPVTDNAQSVYELSTIETVPGVNEEIQQEFGFAPNFDKAKQYLEENDGAGNTFKATAKPVLIGTAVVGATTMIFSIIVALSKDLGMDSVLKHLSLLHAPFLLGLILGGAMIYWFSGATTQAVSTGAYRAVEFIKAHINLENTDKASIGDSKKVVAICTQYAQKGMINIFLAMFFGTLAFAFFDASLFIGYLIALALFGLFQALFMANAGGAWDNAKKIVEVELKEKGSALHAATVVGDTVGDPFKDTSSVAMNPVIKFATLFGLLAVELGQFLKSEVHAPWVRNVSLILSGGFLLISMGFVLRSFYGMRIKSAASEEHKN